MEPSLSENSNRECNSSYLINNSTHVEQDLKAEDAIVESACPALGDIQVMGITDNDNKSTTCQPGGEQSAGILGTTINDDKTINFSPAKKQSTGKSVRKGKKVPQKLGLKKCLLRSSHAGVRVLRSMLKEKNEKPSGPVTSTVNEEVKPRKKKKKGKNTPNDEFSLIRKRVRYMLTRINYEQNLIEAYAGEGWKGQSLDKLRPEKELERAKSEILRCKLKIRESFQQLDSLLSEGKIEESLFDSEGEIDSEDIYCAKCRLTDLSVDNDIILCDGICDRGFHQKCLDPPLLTEKIPVGDEGWLCPACDCKVDCFELLDESQGIDLSIDDTWVNVFPEAAAIANGNNQDKNLDYPSDDSEDDDYNPDSPEVDIEDEKEGSSSEESYSTSLSDESVPLNDKVNFDILALPSDDSEDDDFDPDRPDPIKDTEKEGLASDESDFTSDSDDFCAELSKSANDVSSTSLLGPEQIGDFTNKRNSTYNIAGNSDIPLEYEDDHGQQNALSGKRQREHLNFKKLNDAAYGEESSDSIDDEDWSKTTRVKKVRKDKSVPASSVTPKAEVPSIENGKRLSGCKKKLMVGGDMVEKPNVGLVHASSINGSTNKTLDRKTKNQLPASVGKKGTPSTKRLGKGVVQKLLEYFKEDQYPSRERKERFSEELGASFKQISKWFEHTRHSVKVSNKVAGQPGISIINGSPNANKHPHDPDSAKTADQLGTSVHVSGNEIKSPESTTFAKLADHPEISMDVSAKEIKHPQPETVGVTPLAKSRRRNSYPSKQTAPSVTSNSASRQVMKD